MNSLMQLKLHQYLTHSQLPNCWSWCCCNQTSTSERPPFHHAMDHMDLDPSAAARIGKKLQSKAHSAAKRNVRQVTPLKASKPTQRHASAEQELQWLQQCQNMYETLPKNSKYAQHKRRLVQKAIEILQTKQRSSQQQADLAGLIAQLKL